MATATRICAPSINWTYLVTKTARRAGCRTAFVDEQEVNSGVNNCSYDNVDKNPLPRRPFAVGASFLLGFVWLHDLVLLLMVSQLYTKRLMLINDPLGSDTSDAVGGHPSFF